MCTLRVTLAVSAIALMLIGCEPTSPSSPVISDDKDADFVSSEEVQEEIDEAAEATQQFVAQRKDDYLAQLDEEFKQLDASIEGLKAREENVADDAQAQWEEALRNMESRRAEYQKKYDEVEGASEEAWQDIRQGVAESLKKLRDAVDNAAREFGSQPDDNTDGS